MTNNIWVENKLDNLPPIIRFITRSKLCQTSLMEKQQRNYEKSKIGASVTHQERQISNAELLRHGHAVPGAEVEL